VIQEEIYPTKPQELIQSTIVFTLSELDSGVCETKRGGIVTYSITVNGCWFDDVSRMVAFSRLYY
jgi:hypothetical protein